MEPVTHQKNPFSDGTSGLNSRRVIKNQRRYLHEKETGELTDERNDGSWPDERNDCLCRGSAEELDVIYLSCSTASEFWQYIGVGISNAVIDMEEEYGITINLQTTGPVRGSTDRAVCNGV